MEYVLLSDVGSFSDERISIGHVTVDNYISTENMVPNKGGVIQASSLPDAKKVSKYNPGDILLSNIRPYFKKIWFADCIGGCSNDVLVFHPNKDIDAKFLYYVLSDNNFFNYATLTSKGTKMPRGTKRAILKYWIPNLSLATQQIIASILSAYDSQIENNQKRIKLLELMAENLYKEWFVRFRFPGYENAEFEGGVPKGWTVDVLGNLFETSSGGTPSRKEPKYFENGTIGWVKTGELLDSFIVETEEKITEDAVKHSAAKMIPVGSLLCSMYAGVGKLGITTTPLTCSQATCVFNPKAGVSNRYLFYYLKLNKKYLENISFGAAQQNISQEIIKKIKMIVPPRDFIQSFDRRIEPLWKDILIIMNQNRYLTTQRDLLLPRLMSGKLSI